MYSIQPSDRHQISAPITPIRSKTPDHVPSFIAPKRSISSAETSADLEEIGKHAVAIAYEMRNPLSIILNGIKLCQDLPMTERGRSRLALAAEEAARLKRMVEDIVEFARYREYPELQCCKVDLTTLIANTINAATYQILGTHQPILLKSAPPTIWVWGDCDRLKQVFLNLLTHIHESTSSNQTIYCEIDLDAATSTVWVQIHTRKTPLPFHRLQQLIKRSETINSQRPDICLLTIQRIIEEHSGRFFVQSSSISGTTAGVVLPVH